MSIMHNSLMRYSDKGVLECKYSKKKVVLVHP